MTVVVSSCTDAPPARISAKKSSQAGQANAQGSSGRNAAFDNATAVMKKYCYQCHGLNQSNSGGLTNITDLAQKIQDGLIVAGKPEESKIYDRMASKTSPMPPAGAEKPTADELNAFKQWIADGATTKANTTAALVTEDKILTDASLDLIKEVPNEADRKDVRYLSLAAMQNAGASAESMQILQQAVAKILNSVSKSASVFKPKLSSKNPLLIRFRLSDLEWSKQDWETIIKRYPYQIVPDERKILSLLQEQTDSSLPVIRADWLVANASRPPLYYELLESPAKLGDFTKLLSIDLPKQQAAGNIMRAAFNNSEVADHSRVIERVESPTNFIMWHSYEFGTAKDDKNPFIKPLGPSPVFGDQAKAHAFIPDGKEIIYTLPNGFLGFYVSDHNDTRIDEAPTRGRNAGVISGVAIVGVACMTCHSQGLLEKRDQVRDAILKKTDVPAGVVDMVKTIYSEPAQFTEKIKADTQIYQTALTQAGVDFSKPDPVSQILKTFNDSVSLRIAAGELGVTEDRVINAIEGSQTLSNALSALTTNSSVSRANFSTNFQALMSAVYGVK
jgi:mono/diheme cytochrome c family protein